MATSSKKQLQKIDNAQFICWMQRVVTTSKDSGDLPYGFFSDLTTRAEDFKTKTIFLNLSIQNFFQRCFLNLLSIRKLRRLGYGTV